MYSFFIPQKRESHTGITRVNNDRIWFSCIKSNYFKKDDEIKDKGNNCIDQLKSQTSRLKIVTKMLRKGMLVLRKKFNIICLQIPLWLLFYYIMQISFWGHCKSKTIYYVEIREWFFFNIGWKWIPSNESLKRKQRHNLIYSISTFCYSGNCVQLSSRM